MTPGAFATCGKGGCNRVAELGGLCTQHFRERDDVVIPETNTVPFRAEAFVCDGCIHPTSSLPGCKITATSKGAHMNQPTLCPYDSNNRTNWRLAGTPPGRLH